jgi:hypothetical protein
MTQEELDTIAAIRLEQYCNPLPKAWNSEDIYIVAPDVIVQTQEESETKISESIDLGGGVVVFFGTRYDQPIMLVKNALGDSLILWSDTPN